MFKMLYKSVQIFIVYTIYYADNSHNLSIQSLYTLCTFNSSHALDWLDQSYL